MASTYLYRTLGTPTNNKKWTYSAWVKKSAVTGDQAILGCGADGNNRGLIYFADNGKLYYYETTGGTDTTEIATNRVFRDPSAWYHIVYAVDTTQGTEANRVKVYVNGVQETSLAASNYPNQNATDYINSGIRHDISGRNHAGSSDLYFNGYMSHVSFVDGQALAPTVFGSTDSTSGIWKFKSPSGVTWGDNGFHLKMENSGNLGLDSSGETNNFTLGGNGRQALDTPSNVYATFNALIGKHSNGNTLVPNLDAGSTDAWINSAEWRIAQSTLAVSSGKYYAEFKQSNDYGTDYTYIGIYDVDAYAQKISGYPYIADMANCFSIKNGNGNVYTNASDQGSYGTSYGNGDIIGIAIDLDNNKIYWSKNGTWMNSANPSNGTGGYSITADKTYAFGIQLFNNAWRGNFGNGYFGTTAISSAGSNGNGSLFEYDVPSGYYALNTKNINTYG